MLHVAVSGYSRADSVHACMIFTLEPCLFMWITDEPTVIAMKIPRGPRAHSPQGLVSLSLACACMCMFCRGGVFFGGVGGYLSSTGFSRGDSKMPIPDPKC